MQTVCHFVVACFRYARDEYQMEIDTVEHLNHSETCSFHSEIDEQPFARQWK